MSHGEVNFNWTRETLVYGYGTEYEMNEGAQKQATAGFTLGLRPVARPRLARPTSVVPSYDGLGRGPRDRGDKKGVRRGRLGGGGRDAPDLTIEQTNKTNNTTMPSVGRTTACSFRI